MEVGEAHCHSLPRAASWQRTAKARIYMPSSSHAPYLGTACVQRCTCMNVTQTCKGGANLYCAVRWNATKPTAPDCRTAPLKAGYCRTLQLGLCGVLIIQAPEDRKKSHVGIIWYGGSGGTCCAAAARRLRTGPFVLLPEQQAHATPFLQPAACIYSRRGILRKYRSRRRDVWRRSILAVMLLPPLPPAAASPCPAMPAVQVRA